MLGDLWTDHELRSAVDAYLYALRLQEADVEYSERSVREFLLASPLNRRNGASVRYRMRNISSVMRARGWPILSAFSPANQVGSGVKVRIEAILDSYPGAFLAFLQKRDQGRPGIPTGLNASDALKQNAIERLRELESALDDVHDRKAGIGHNHPPEPLEDTTPLSRDLIFIRDSARALREELLKAAPDKSLVEQKKSRIADLGLRLAGWVGERITRFTDAALVTLAPVLVMKITHVLPLISDSIGAVTRFLEHLAP
jgi:hypothetical protein